MRGITRLRIREYPDPVLREECRPVGRITGAIEHLATCMMYAMKEAGGIGLAAPQVGQAIRMLVIDTVGQVPEGKLFESDFGFSGVMYNPEIVEKKGTIKFEEGCLSFPGEQKEVDRAAWIKVKYMNKYGTVSMNEFQGLTAICVQHEIDHLNGKLFTDYEA